MPEHLSTADNGYQDFTKTHKDTEFLIMLKFSNNIAIFSFDTDQL